MIDIRDHGAEEGIDCSAIIQSLVDTAEEPIFIPAGRWKFSGINITRGIRLEGAGMGGVGFEATTIETGSGVGITLGWGASTYCTGHLISHMAFEVTPRTGTTTCTAAAGSHSPVFASPIFGPGDLVLIRGAGWDGADHVAKVMPDGQLNEPIRIAVTDAVCEFYDCAIHAMAALNVAHIRITDGMHGVFVQGATDGWGDVHPILNANGSLAWNLVGLRCKGTTLRVQGNNANAGNFDVNASGGGPNHYQIEDNSQHGNHYRVHVQGPKEIRTAGPSNATTIVGTYMEHGACDLAAATTRIGGTPAAPNAYQSGGGSIVNSQGTLYQSKTAFQGTDGNTIFAEPGGAFRIEFPGASPWLRYMRSGINHGRVGLRGFSPMNDPRNAAILEDDDGGAYFPHGFQIGLDTNQLADGYFRDFNLAYAAPTTGTHKAGDYVMDASGATGGWQCTTGGTPGTWVALPRADVLAGQLAALEARVAVLEGGGA